MAWVANELFRQDFTNASKIVVTHNLDREYLAVRVIVDFEVVSEELFAIGVDEEDPTNVIIIFLKTALTGTVQVLEYDLIPVGVQSATVLAITDLGFTQAFGSQYHYAEDLTRVTTSSNSFVQRLRLNVNITKAGLYRISTSFTWDSTRADRSILAQLEVDDTTTIWDMRDESTDTAATQQRFALGTAETELVLLGVHTIDLDFARSGSPATVAIDQARIEFWRI